MSQSIPISGIHHVTLTVADVARSADFYERHLGFGPLVDLGARRLLINGSIILAVTLPSDPTTPVPPDDRFSENRIGLDHISFRVESLAAIEAGAAYLDEQGVFRGEIRDLCAGFRIDVRSVRDPDNIQLELTAPYAA